MRNRLKIAALVVGALAALAAVQPAGADPAITFSDDKSQVVYGGGSDTTYLLMRNLADAYNSSQGCEQIFPYGQSCEAPVDQGSGVVKTENYDHENVVTYYPTGSGNGRTTLCDQTTPRPATVPIQTFGRSSSGPSVSGCTDSGLTLRFVAFAKDAIAPVNWRSAPGAGSVGVSDISSAEANDIWVDCTINNWQELGGGNVPIEVWTAQPGSGTRSSWDGFVGGNSESCAGGRIIFENDVSPVEAAGNEENAFFFMSVGTYNVDPNKRGNSELVAVNGVVPTNTTIQNGNFLFSRNVYNVYRQAGPAPLVTSPTKGFIGETGWICKPQGSHSEPVGTPGPGVEISTALKDYGQHVLDVIAVSGFVPVATNGNHCTFSDITVP